MDFDSVDGTREVVMSREWESFVTMTPFPGIADLDSSNLLLAEAKELFGRDYWCLFCDPDELLVTPSMNIVDIDAFGSIERADCLLIPRFNITAARSVAQFEQERLTPFDALTLKIERRHHRTIEPHAFEGPLNPPWIFTAIPGKAFVSLDTATRIGDGDHTAETAQPPAFPTRGVYLLHYPFRSFASFVAKVQLAETDFAANSELPPTYGWQLRRWVTLAKRGELFEEYLHQFVPDQDVARLLHDGTLSREHRIIAAHR